MKLLLVILLTSMLTENMVLVRFMGICPFLGVSKKYDSAIGMGLAVIFVMVCASICTYPIYTFVLVPLGVEYMKTVAFILLIATFVQLVEMIIKKKIPPLYKSLGVYLPLITTNCAVLGITILNTDESYNFVQSIVNALGGGLGFTIALIIFASVRSRIETSDIPKTFKGVPSTLIAAAIVSVSFMGFTSLLQ
ncbi:MAG: RnfABCDGE type electron transport complex subunit A [Ruminococcus sp.]|jgi:electron transport complex protein RnfA|nr:RnfABCDGE type electron transport complex subunit A [Ruminococcus sp.]